MSLNSVVLFGPLASQSIDHVHSQFRLFLMDDGCSVEAVFVLQVRKYRTMTELIVDAIEFVKNPYKGKKLKVRPHPGLVHHQVVLFSSVLFSSGLTGALVVQTHPDFPKKPLTPYFRFFMEKRAKYAKIHPEMSNLDLTKILSKKYKELPDKKKVRRTRRSIG